MPNRPGTCRVDGCGNLAKRRRIIIPTQVRGLVEIEMDLCDEHLTAVYRRPERRAKHDA